MLKLITFVAVFLISHAAYSQLSEVTLRGKVIDAAGLNGVSNAVVSATGAGSYTSITDSSGMYSLSVLPGKYTLRVKHGSYTAVSREHVVVSTGKDEVQNFELSELSLHLDTVAVSAEQPVNSFEMNNWNNQRFAAVFYDPARVVNSHAGIINVDDQANNVSVRGTSPNYVQWKLEGVEIVNPNHLENAGMGNDRPAFNGGGVSMISNQMLQRSSFYFAPFDAMHGNALSGIFDIRLKNGNDAKREYTVQASLLGTDLSVEGPFSKKSKSSYLVNFRYSTVGLLSMMGVNFGDEKISFMDFSWQLAFPMKKGMFKVFGVAGSSSNYYKGKRDTVLVEIEKDLKDIAYSSRTAISGFSVITSLSGTLYIKAVGAYSVKETERISSPLFPYSGIAKEVDEFSQRKISSLVYVSKRFGRRYKIKLGSYMNSFRATLFSSIDTVQLVSSALDDLVVQPFLSGEVNVFSKLYIEAGVHSLYSSLSGSFIPQPRCQVAWRFSERHSLSLHAGTTAQVQSVALLAGNEMNKKLKPVSMNSISLTHQLMLKTITLKTETYYHRYSGIPVNDSALFSAFNYFNGVVSLPLHSNGEAAVYGAEMSVQKNVREFYCMLSAGVYNSSYESSRKTYSSKFNANYNVVLTAGNDFILKDKRKSLGLHIRSFVRDGFREADLLQSNPYDLSVRLPVYYRVDFRISYKKERTRSSYTWALDLQNVTNAKNVVYYYYDHVTKKIEARKQFGLIPVVSYKVYF